MRILKLTLLLLVSLPVFATNDLIVRQKTGDSPYSITTIKEVTFPKDGSGVVLSFVDGTSKTFARSQFVSLRFDGSLSGAEMISSDNQSAIIYNPKTSEIYLLGDNSMIEVYTSTGTLVAEGESSLSVSHLATGTYIVKAGNLTSKIVKR